MKISLADLQKFVKVNPTMIGKVTNPVMLDKGMTPTYDGLLSTEIFGNTTKDRSHKFGFIDLKGFYFQPIVYKNLRRLDRRIDGIAAGRIRVRIEKDGTMVEDENGQTGLEFIYKNWDKIKYKKNNSSIRNERIELFDNHSKEELFTNVWVISPAMYRDINLQNSENGKISYHEINSMYSKLIRLVAMLGQDSSFTPILNNTRYMIQSTLIDIYNYYKNLIEKKNGTIRKSLLGKSVDYGSRLVITTPNYNVNHYKEMDVDFYHAGIPLANCCSLFTPFILGWVRNFLQRELEFTSNKYPFKGKNGEVEFKPLKDPMSYYNEEKIQKMMDTFVFSYSGRFDKIIIPTEDMDTDPKYMYFSGSMISQDTLSESQKKGIGARPMTLTDLFFMAACDVCKDKHVYITRYPLTDYLGVFPIGISVLSTHHTAKMKVGEKTYTHYPLIDLSLSDSEVASAFVDTVRFQNVYLKVIGGDYDGDQISVKGVYSQSANLEAAKILRSKMNIIGIGGKGLRKTTNETVQTLYMMTKFKDM